MKKKEFFFILFFLIGYLLIFITSCNKCNDKDLTHYGYLPEMNKYFGMYKQGNWWVYKNQDSTKTDSIYITNFKEEIYKDNNQCFDYPSRKFKLHSQFLLNGGNSFNGRYMNNQSCCDNEFRLLICVEMNNTINTHPISCGIPEIIYDSIIISNIKYYNVIYVKAGSVQTYFAPQVGIVRFIDQTDTFSIQTCYIQ